ncbi:30S ribosomal protein S2 [Anopheles sinensis]|uniref:30S ribosomal protein S2 n=1 Tax=Anopheles sinensis TaxID=74873 RepID=A0A084WUD9_ANOSI|nr:30S ribosomal protein S2 [Anopheles sinensis]
MSMSFASSSPSSRRCVLLVGTKRYTRTPIRHALCFVDAAATHSAKKSRLLMHPAAFFDAVQRDMTVAPKKSQANVKSEAMEGRRRMSKRQKPKPSNHSLAGSQTRR